MILVRLSSFENQTFKPMAFYYSKLAYKLQLETRFLLLETHFLQLETCLFQLKTPYLLSVTRILKKAKIPHKRPNSEPKRQLIVLSPNNFSPKLVPSSHKRCELGHAINRLFSIWEVISVHCHLGKTPT